MNLPDTEPINDPGGLWALQTELLAMAKSMYGPRDQSFRIFQPQFCKNGPNIRIEYVPRGAYAQLSYNGRFYWPTVVYELAHETVHLLNPVKQGEANYLEEGVAVVFSLHAQKHFGVRVQRPSMPSYTCALSLVKALPNDSLQSAGRIRKEVGRFSDVTADDLVGLFPALDVDVANRLSNKFKR